MPRVQKPRKPRRQRQQNSIGNVRIKGGQVINQMVARIVCRCEECLGELEMYNNSLFCKADKSHKGRIHRDDAAIELERRQRDYEVVIEAGYAVEGGRLVAIDPTGEKQNAN
jgi:hypothetical protein